MEGAFDTASLYISARPTSSLLSSGFVQISFSTVVVAFRQSNEGEVDVEPPAGTFVWVD